MYVYTTCEFYLKALHARVCVASDQLNVCVASDQLDLCVASNQLNVCVASDQLSGNKESYEASFHHFCK